MTNDRRDRILAYFDEILPEAGCELIYHSPVQLLVAVVLSAQTTDVSVNKATPGLWSKFITLQALADASIEEISATIRTIGLYQTKAKHLKLLAQALLTNHGGQVPSDKQQLMKLPGVGPKTAAVVRAELFHIPEIPVDTHVARIAKRLGFAKSTDNVTTIERKMRRTLPRDRYIQTHHQMIHFGRYYCPSRGMPCFECPLRELCKEKNKNLRVK